LPIYFITNNAEQAKETIDRQLESSDRNYDFRKLKILIAKDDEVSEMLIGSYIKMCCHYCPNCFWTIGRQRKGNRNGLQRLYNKTHQKV